MQPFTLSPQMRKSLATIIALIAGFTRREQHGEIPDRSGRSGPAGRRLRNATRSI